jgi:Mn-containing catalase
MKEPRQSFPIPMAPERPEEFAPGLDPELQEMADALIEFKENMLNPKKTSILSKGNKKK